MNKPLQALITQLNWQQNDLSVQLHNTRNQRETFTQQRTQLEDQMRQAHIKLFSPVCGKAMINPEFEMTKHHFIIQQHEKKTELILIVTKYHEQEHQLKERTQAVKTELKRFENYLQRDNLSKKRQQKKQQDNSMDEWGMQHYE